jgi:hypothetical protein
VAPQSISDAFFCDPNRAAADSSDLDHISTNSCRLSFLMTIFSIAEEGPILDGSAKLVRASKARVIRSMRCMRTTREMLPAAILKASQAEHTVVRTDALIRTIRRSMIF